MLHEFITDNRDRIIAMARASVAERTAPRPTAEELEHGVPLFLSQLVELLQPTPGTSAELRVSATARGNELHKMGFSVAQVVHDYGNICQAITSLAAERHQAITVQEFRTLNLSLDDAIARAVTEYAHQRERAISQTEAERLHAFADGVRNLLSTASLSYELLKLGTVGPGGSTSGLLGRSLASLRDLVDRTLALLRLDQGPLVLEHVPVRELMEELEISATIEAQERGIRLVMGAVQTGLAVAADRQILAAALVDVTHRAIVATPRGGEVSIRTTSNDQRVRIDVEDGCTSERAYVDEATSLARRAVKANGGVMGTREVPSHVWIVTIDLPKQPLLT